VQFLEGELEGNRITEYLAYFVELTQGIPIMIITLLKVIKSGTNLGDIKKDTVITDYVEKLFENFSETTAKEKELQKKDIEKVIKLVALIEPINIENVDLVQHVATTEDVPEKDVDVIFQALKDQKIISGRYIYSIKPDMYSDLILGKALGSEKWLNNKLVDYGEYINNIIKNIGYVYQYDDKNALLESLLKKHIGQIDFCTNYEELSKILETVFSITYSFPLLAEEAVEKVIAIYSNEKHPLYTDFQESIKYKNFPFDSTTNSLKNILRNLFHLEDHYDSSFVY
jgi:hypothetical protein